MAATMNNARVLQVPPQPRWPSGDSRDLAVLGLAPAQLSERVSGSGLVVGSAHRREQIAIRLRRRRA